MFPPQNLDRSFIHGISCIWPRPLILVTPERAQTLPKGVFHLFAHEKSPLDSTYHHRIVIIIIIIIDL